RAGWPRARGSPAGTEPFMRAAAIDEVAAQRLPAIEAVAVDAAIAQQRQGLGDDDLGAGDCERQVDAQHGGEMRGLRPGGDDQLIAAELARIGTDSADASAGDGG